MALGDIFGRLVEALSDMMRGSVLAQRDALDQLLRTVNPEEQTLLNQRRNIDIPFDPSIFNELATAIHRTINILDRTALESSSVLKQIKQGVANTPFRVGYWHPNEATVASHPDYVRPISPISDILYMRTGLLAGMSDKRVSPNMQNFLEPFIKAGSLLRNAAQEFDTLLELSMKNVQHRILPQEAYVREKAYMTPDWLRFMRGLTGSEHPQFTGADLNTLREVVRRSYYEGGLHQFEQLSSETTRYQFARGRTISYLTEYAKQLPEKQRGPVLALSAELDRSFNDLIETNAEKLIQEASNQISRYSEAFRTVSTVQVGHLNYMTAIGHGGMMSSPRQVVSWESVGRVGQELQGKLHQLLQTVALPHRKDEVERYVDSVLQWATQSMVQDLYINREKLPQGLRRVVESLHEYQGTHEGLLPLVSKKEKQYEEKSEKLSETQQQFEQFKEQFTRMVKEKTEAENLTPQEAEARIRSEIREQINKLVEQQVQGVQPATQRPLTKLLEEEKPQHPEEALAVGEVPPEYNKPKPGEEGRVALEKVENLIDILKEEAKTPVTTTPTVTEGKPFELPPVLELPSGVKVPRSWIEKEMPEVLEKIQPGTKQTGLNQIIEQLQGALAGLVDSIKRATEQLGSISYEKGKKTTLLQPITTTETEEETPVQTSEGTQPVTFGHFKGLRRRTRTRDIAKRIKEEWERKRQQEEEYEEEIAQSEEAEARQVISDEDLMLQAFREIKEKRIKEYAKRGKGVSFELPELQLQEELGLEPVDIEKPIVRPDLTYMNLKQRELFYKQSEPLAPIKNATGFLMPLLNELDELGTIGVPETYMLGMGYNKIQAEPFAEFSVESPQLELPDYLTAGFVPAEQKKLPQLKFEPLVLEGEQVQGPAESVKSLDDAAEAMSNASKAARKLEQELTRLAEEIPEGKAQATQAQIRYSPELQRFLQSFEEEMRRGSLKEFARTEPELYERLAKTMQLVKEAGVLKEQVVSGKLPLWTRFKEGVLAPAYESTSGFLTMNARNFEVAFMFGLSSGVFQALNEIPMRSVYETMTPVFHSVGGLTGLLPFWQEFQQFGQQVPQIVADLQTRMNTIQALMGSRLYAEQAVTSAIQLARVQPIQFPQAMEVLTALSVYPSTKLQATSPQFQQQVFNAVQLLSLLAPEQGIGGALFAIREMLGGQFRSLQMRFNIGPETLAAYAGKTLEQFKGAPGSEKLEILVKALENMFGGEEVLFRKGAQFDVQLKNIGDTLVQAVALPMVTKIQPAFASMINSLMGFKSTGSAPTTIEAIQKTPFFQSLPQAQSAMLLRIAESRAYTEIESKYSKRTIDTILKEAGRNPKEVTTPQERAATLLKLDPKLDQHLLAIQRELNKQTVLQIRSLAVNTYGNTTGMLAYMATIFNQSLGPLVNAFTVGSGLTNLIGTFAHKFVPQTIQFQAQEKYAATEKQRQQAAIDFLQNFVQDLQSTLVEFRKGVNSGEFKSLISQIMGGVRDVIMTAFGPVTEAVMLQTLRTGIELPGKMVGGTAEYLFQSIVAANAPGIARVVTNLTGVAAGLSMTRLAQGRLTEGLLGVLGFSLLQRGLTSIQTGGPTQTGLIETGLGLAQTMMLVPSLRASLSMAISGGLEKMSETFARSGLSSKLDSLITSFRLTRVGQFIPLKPVMVETGERLNYGIKVLRPSYLTLERALGGLAGLGLAGLEAYQTFEGGRTSTQRVLTGIGSVAGLAGSAMMFIQPGIGAVLLGLSTALEGLTALLSHRQQATQAEVTAGQRIELVKTVTQNELADMKTAIRNQVEAASKTYHLSTTATTAIQKAALETEYKPRAYFMGMTSPTSFGSQVSAAIQTVITQYKEGNLSTAITTAERMPLYQQAFATLEAARLRTNPEASRNIPAERARMETAIADLLKRLAPTEYTIAQYRAQGKPVPVETTNKERQIIEGWIKTYLPMPSNYRPGTAEAENFMKMREEIIRGLLEAVHVAGQRMKDEIQKSQPLLTHLQSQVLGPAIARKVMFQQVYSLGIPEIPTIPKRLFETTGGASQLQQRLTELTGIEQQYMQRAGRFFGGTLTQALSLGVISPREYEVYRRAFANQFLEHLRKGLIGPQLGLQLFSQFYGEFTPQQLPEVYRLLNKSIARTSIEQLAKGHKLEVELTKVHVNTRGLDEAIDKLVKALMSGAVSIAEAGKRAAALITSALAGKYSVPIQNKTVRQIEEKYKVQQPTKQQIEETKKPPVTLKQAQQQLLKESPFTQPLNPSEYSHLTPAQQQAVKYYLHERKILGRDKFTAFESAFIGPTNELDLIPPEKRILYKTGKSIVGENVKGWEKVIEQPKPPVQSTPVTPTPTPTPSKEHEQTSLLDKVMDFFVPTAKAVELPHMPQQQYQPLSVNTLHALVRQAQPIHQAEQKLQQFTQQPMVKSILQPIESVVKPITDVLKPMANQILPTPVNQVSKLIQTTGLQPLPEPIKPIPIQKQREQQPTTETAGHIIGNLLLNQTPQGYKVQSSGIVPDLQMGKGITPAINLPQFTTKLSHIDIGGIIPELSRSAAAMGGFEAMQRISTGEDKKPLWNPEHILKAVNEVEKSPKVLHIERLHSAYSVIN